VVNASRILGAVSMILGVVPMVGTAFGWLSWDADQANAYMVAYGTVITAIGLAFGIRIEKVVTPVASPRDDAGNPLTPGPIGSDNANELPSI
jgi:hypothetical protein